MLFRESPLELSTATLASVVAHPPVTLLGYGATWAVGLTLGLIGGGGSLLTVPILVYLFDIGATRATGYSLFIVGATSLVGAVAQARLGNVATRVAAIFAGPSLAAAYAVRRWLVPALPPTVTAPGLGAAPTDVLLMLAFAAVMAAAGTMMIRGRERIGPAGSPTGRPVRLAALGAAVGSIAGLFGAGGGFLIVPALVLVAGLAMPLAVGTSLAIISLQSLAGFVGVVQTADRIEWPLLLGLTALALFGMAAGLLLGRRVCASKLRAGFGWFVCAMSVVVVVAEIVTWARM